MSNLSSCLAGRLAVLFPALRKNVVLAAVAVVVLGAFAWNAKFDSQYTLLIRGGDIIVEVHKYKGLSDCFVKCYPGNTPALKGKIAYYSKTKQKLAEFNSYDINYDGMLPLWHVWFKADKSDYLIRMPLSDQKEGGQIASAYIHFRDMGKEDVSVCCSNKLCRSAVDLFAFTPVFMSELLGTPEAVYQP